MAQKYILGLSLALLVLLQTFSKAIIVCAFAIHRAPIAQALCMNRDEPESHCNGKCVLMRRLQADEGQGKSAFPSGIKSKVEENYCSSGSEGSLLQQREPQVARLLFAYTPGNSRRHLSDVFHPPQA